MNLLLKQELIDKCDDKLPLIDFFDEIDFLDSFKDKNSNELSEDEIKRFNDIIDFSEETLLVITYLFLDDYYMKPMYKKIIRFFLVKLDKNFYDINKEYYDMVGNYSRRLDELLYALDAFERLEISEVKTIYELILLTFITSINDLAIYDYNMLNKNKYNDSDLEDLSSIKSSARAYELSLITINRKLKKENS